MTQHSEKDVAKDAVVFSTVSIPPVGSVEIENPTLKPQDGICDMCRRKPGDIFCDGFPACFNCMELMIERERILGGDKNNLVAKAMRSGQYPVPFEWEKD